MKASWRALAHNILSLYGVQAVNILIPIFTFPYLVRTIGFDGFGLLSYTFSWVQLGVVFAALGFNYTATREVARDREDLTHIGRLLTSVIISKAVIAGLAGAVVFLLSRHDAMISGHPELVLGCGLLLVGEVLFPIWLFLGMERMRLIAIFNFIGRLIGALLLVLMVRARADLLWAAMCQSIPTVLSGILSLVWAHRQGIRLQRVALPDVFGHLKESAKAFSTSLPAHVYARGQFIVLGQYVGAAEVGYYSVAQRVTGLFSTLTSPIAETFYPRLCALHESEDEETRAQLWPLRRKLIAVAVAGGLALVGGLLLGAPLLIRLIAGEFDDRSTFMLRLFAPLVGCICVSVLMRPFTMVLRRYRAVFVSVLIGATCFVTVAPELTSRYGAEGMIGAMVIVEALIMIQILWISRERL